MISKKTSDTTHTSSSDRDDFDSTISWFFQKYPNSRLTFEDVAMLHIYHDLCKACRYMRRSEGVQYFLTALVFLAAWFSVVLLSEPCKREALVAESVFLAQAFMAGLAGMFQEELKDMSGPAKYLIFAIGHTVLTLYFACWTQRLCDSSPRE